MARAGRLQLGQAVGQGGITLKLTRAGLVTIAVAVIGVQALSAREFRMANLKEELARIFSKTDLSMSSFFRMDGVVAEALATPFLVNGGIARVINRATRVPRPTYVGFAGHEYAEFLPGHRDAFARLVSKAGINIANDELRAGLIRTFLETTAKQPSRFFLLTSADEIQARPGLTPEEQGAFAEFIARYKNVIAAPPLQAADGKWSTVRYAIVDRDLVEFEVSLSPNGAVDVKETVLEKDLLIPYVMH
jgi:hypothetical protein